ncbi:Replication factor C, subunit RFC4 [Tilletia horrida]|uniref:Replication factor C, subunit RFC4 n=1 Tax=Tilletia horrida TaxID=155126 RepID=A0AAN6JHJ3_9BASI|nr:Replication factor C, subunit RFC4 [Tilletia horrida]KAK0521199.1 Replication factor C, subunit RFC4 [Tilletia horrida]KAK0559139.1 Replication factor C, subunit RFC4 [Tilletia horrida]
MSFGTHRSVGDEQRRQRQYDYAVSQAAKGAALGLGVALPVAYVLNKRWAPFRRLNLPVQAFFVSSASIATGVIAADKAGIRFDEQHYTDRGAELRRRALTAEEQMWAELSTRDRILTHIKDNQFAAVAGIWALSLGGIFAYIRTQPLSGAQKLVQARVYAQGITLASLLGLAGISQIPSAGDKILNYEKEASQHSWRNFIPPEPAAAPAASRQA